MIQWAKPVIQVASETPDSHVDKGLPILAVMPFSLWACLSSIFSAFLYAYLKTKKLEEGLLKWLKGRIGSLINIKNLGLKKGDHRTESRDHHLTQSPFVSPPIMTNSLEASSKRGIYEMNRDFLLQQK
jgi:hypothetical protein